MKSFELQTFKNGQWAIQGVFTDQDLALFEARRCVEGNRFPGVRVVEENYNETNNRTRSRTIFNGGLADEENTANRQEENATQRKTRQAFARRKERFEAALGTRKARKSGEPGYIKIILCLFIIVMAGLAALFGLQDYFLSH